MLKCTDHRTRRSTLGPECLDACADRAFDSRDLACDRNSENPILRL